MPARTRRSSAHVRGSRRQLVWCTFDQTVAMAAGVGSNSNLLAGLAVAGSSLLGVTIMRTHLELSVITAVTLGDRLQLGLIVGRTADIGAPIPAGAVSPAQPDDDWMLWRHETAAPTYGSGSANNQLLYDVKSKRKMQELNQAYVLSMVNDVGVAKTINIQGRVLLALP
jgi:hypothetical protein